MKGHFTIFPAYKTLKANRAAYLLRQAISTGSGNIINIKLAMNLFDKLISPVLLYGSCVWGIPNTTNLLYLSLVAKGGNTLSKAKHTLMTIYGKNFDIKSARRVGKVDVNKPRDILIDMTSIEDKFFLLYNQAQSGINRNPILNFDTKTENLAYEKIHTKFLKMIIGVSKYTDNSSVFGELGRYPISFKCLALCVKYWHHLAVGKSPNTFLNCAYMSEVNNKSSWIQSIQYLLSVNGLGHLWENPYQVSNVMISKKKLNFVLQINLFKIGSTRHLPARTSLLSTL